MDGEVLRYTAFPAGPGGGNPAGVVLDAGGLDDAAMLAIAADVGYSETAFLTNDGGRTAIRYFSPVAEVTFCGHATIAAAVAYAERHGAGDLLLHTVAGPVDVSVRQEEGRWTATLTSVPPRVEPLRPEVLDALLRALGWDADDLDVALPPLVAYAGAWHPVLAAATRERLADLDHDMDALATLAASEDWTTVDLVWRERPHLFHSRNPFPAGGIREDPATGAAAAAFGGYLRATGAVDVPATVRVLQGFDMGRPSELVVGIGADPASGIRVTGTANAVPGGPAAAGPGAEAS